MIQAFEKKSCNRLQQQRRSKQAPGLSQQQPQHPRPEGIAPRYRAIQVEQRDT